MSFTRRFKPLKAGVDLSSSSVGDLSDVTITSAASGDLLQWNGSAWVNTKTLTGSLVFDAIPDFEAGAQVSQGSWFRVYDSTDTDYVSFAHDGTDLNITQSGTSHINFPAITVKFTDASSLTNDQNSIWLESSAPGIEWYETDAATDEKRWNFTGLSGDLSIRAVSDDGTSSLEFFDIVRGTGVAVARIDFKGLDEGLRVRDGASLRVYEAADSDYIELTHDGSQGSLTTNSGPIQIEPASGVAAVYDSTATNNGQFYVYDSTGVDYIRLTHNGTNAGILNSSGSLQYNSTGVHQFFYNGASDGVIRVYDDANSDYLQLTSNGSAGQISHNGDATFSVVDFGSVADDATVTYTMPGNYNMIFVVTTYNDTAYCQLINDTNTVTTIASGSNTTVGGTVDTSVDVDTDLNVWVTSAGDVLNIKNRLGSARVITAWIMSTS